MLDYGECVLMLVFFCCRPHEVPVEAAAAAAHIHGATIGGGAAPITVGAGKLRCPAPISRLRVEKIEGGLMVAGVVIAANCQIILPIFGFLFMLIGCVLTGKHNSFFDIFLPQINF